MAVRSQPGPGRLPGTRLTPRAGSFPRRGHPGTTSWPPPTRSQKPHPTLQCVQPEPPQQVRPVQGETHRLAAAPWNATEGSGSIRHFMQGPGPGCASAPGPGEPRVGTSPPHPSEVQPGGAETKLVLPACASGVRGGPPHRVRLRRQTASPRDPQHTPILPSSQKGPRRPQELPVQGSPLSPPNQPMTHPLPPSPATPVPGTSMWATPTI